MHPTIEQQVVLMFDAHLPGMAEIADGNCNANNIADAMRTQVSDTTKVAEWQDPLTLDAYRDVLKAVLAPLLAPQTQADANMVRLLERTEASQAYTRMLEAGISEKAVIKLARRIAGETQDVEQAWVELEGAVEIALRVQAEGRTPSNHGDFVDEVLRRAAAYAADGEYQSAGAEIDAALAQADAQIVRLLDRGVEVALLDGDTARAAGLLVRKADVEAGGVAAFEDLRTLRRGYMEIGRDKGRNLDSELAIDLARNVLVRASSVDERGTALNDLGIALQTLGERDSDTTRLEEAVTAYRAALEEYTRDRVPLDWAMTQNNLGTALSTLGERDSGTKRLEEAVTAYRAALEECTRDRVPMGWAMTQNNLGNALSALGERESGTARLEEAVEAYRAALEEYTRDRVPLHWAMTHGNLANVHAAFFQKNNDSAHLDEAETYAMLAKEVFVEAGASQYVEMIDKTITKIQSLRP